MVLADIDGPAFVRSDDFVYRAGSLRIVPVYAGEMPPVVFHGAVYVSAAGEFESNPADNFFWSSDFNIPSFNY